MRVVGYVRVSKGETPAEHGVYGPDDQERALRAWATANGHELITTFRDEGVWGSNNLDYRRGLPEAIATMRDLGSTQQGWGKAMNTKRGTTAGIVVYRLDRLACDLISQEALLVEIRRHGGRVFSCSEADSAHLVDNPEDPDRRLIRQVLDAITVYEQGPIAQRLRAGKRGKGKAPKRPAGVPQPSGWGTV